VVSGGAADNENAGNASAMGAARDFAMNQRVAIEFNDNPIFQCRPRVDASIRLRHSNMGGLD
jgi:hypothetical protein